MAVTDNLDGLHDYFVEITESAASTNGWSSSDTSGVLDSMEDARDEASSVSWGEVAGWLSGASYVTDVSNDDEEVETYLVQLQNVYGGTWGHLAGSDRMVALVTAVQGTGAYDVSSVELVVDAIGGTTDDFVAVAETAGDIGEAGADTAKSIADQAKESPYLVAGVAAAGGTAVILAYAGIRRQLRKWGIL